MIVLTDENSGEVVDPLAIGGQAWAYMGLALPWRPRPRLGDGGRRRAALHRVMGVNPGPLSPKCTSCGFANDPNVIADKAAGAWQLRPRDGGYYLPTQRRP